MVLFDEVANIIMEGLRNSLPNNVDEEIEKKKLKEKDEKPYIVECLHHVTITHTNGDIQCLRCKRMLKEMLPKWRK